MGMRIFQVLACLGLALSGCARTHVTVRRAEPQMSVAQPAEKPVAAPEAADMVEDDVWGAMPRLLRTLNEARQTRGAPALEVDRGLALVAQNAVAEYQRLGRGFETQVASQAKRELRSFSLVFAQVVAVVLCVDRLDQAQSALSPAMDPQMRFVGIAVARAPNPASERGGYAVVVTLGR